jgi:hypothetical protein
METPKTSYKKSLLIELAVLSTLFGLSFLFPMCTFYYLGGDESVIEKPQYANSFQVSELFIVYFLMVLLALLSAKKVILHIVNIVVLLSAVLTYFLVILSFGWWGASPFHPDLNIGFSLINLFLLILIIRSYMWTGKLQNLNRSIATKILTVFSVVVPITFFFWVIKSYLNDKNAPIKRSEWILQERNNRIVKMDSWDYLEGYNAFADKYYSKSKADSLKDTYILDSVRFTFFNDKSKIEKRFSVNAKNGELDVERILDSQ